MVLKVLGFVLIALVCAHALSHPNGAGGGKP